MRNIINPVHTPKGSAASSGTSTARVRGARARAPLASAGSLGLPSLEAQELHGGLMQPQAALTRGGQPSQAQPGGAEDAGIVRPDGGHNQVLNHVAQLNARAAAANQPPTNPPTHSGRPVQRSVGDAVARFEASHPQNTAGASSAPSTASVPDRVQRVIAQARKGGSADLSLGSLASAAAAIGARISGNVAAASPAADSAQQLSSRTNVKKLASALFPNASVPGGFGAGTSHAGGSAPVGGEALPTPSAPAPMPSQAHSAPVTPATVPGEPQGSVGKQQGTGPQVYVVPSQGRASAPRVYVVQRPGDGGHPQVYAVPYQTAGEHTGPAPVPLIPPQATLTPIPGAAPLSPEALASAHRLLAAAYDNLAAAHSHAPAPDGVAAPVGVPSPTPSGTAASANVIPGQATQPQIVVTQTPNAGRVTINIGPRRQVVSRAPVATPQASTAAPTMAPVVQPASAGGASGVASVQGTREDGSAWPTAPSLASVPALGRSTTTAIANSMFSILSNHSQQIHRTIDLEYSVLGGRRSPSVVPPSHSVAQVWYDGVPESVNANYVTKGSNPYSCNVIAAQGPSTNGLADETSSFLALIADHRVDHVVSLDNRNEYRYWPPLSATRQVVLGDRTFELSTLRVAQHDSYDITTLRLKDLNTGQGRIVRAYSFSRWPDQGVPAGPAFDQYMAFTRSINPSTGVGNTIVHCADGAGRSGTQIALWSLMNDIHARRVDRSNLLSSVMQTVWNGRIARGPSFIQSPEQLQLVIDAALSEINRLEGPDVSFGDPLSRSVTNHWLQGGARGGADAAGFAVRQDKPDSGTTSGPLTYSAIQTLLQTGKVASPDRQDALVNPHAWKVMISQLSSAELQRLSAGVFDSASGQVVHLPQELRTVVLETYAELTFPSLVSAHGGFQRAINHVRFSGEFSFDPEKRDALIRCLRQHQRDAGRLGGQS